jgi:phosphatidylserine/phosphatidylglycerophosphate/cardiolipin synthase-like enzyme
VAELLPQTRKFLWILTTDIEDLDVPRWRHFVPMLEILSDLVGAGVSVRILHARETGPGFKRDFNKYPNLLSSRLFDRILCPRIDSKAIIVDGTRALVSSANLTGAVLGAKRADQPNFEASFLTTDTGHLQNLMKCIDRLYLGEFCIKCQYRSVCSNPIM